jgi:hypothetical protein
MGFCSLAAAPICIVAHLVVTREAHHHRCHGHLREGVLGNVRMSMVNEEVEEVRNVKIYHNEKVI